MVLRLPALALVSVFLAALVSLPSEAGAVAVPDSTSLARWADQHPAGARLSVTTALGVVHLAGARAAADGITGFEPATRATALTALDLRPRTIPWAEVQRVDRLGSYAGRGAKWGLIAGLVGGVVVAATAEPYGSRFSTHAGTDYPGTIEPATQVMIVLGSVVLGAGAGTLCGVMTPRWERWLP